METEGSKTTIRRIGGYLHRVVPIFDKSGEIINYALKPLMVEFRPRDVFQIIVGVSILAIPMAMTEEIWNLSKDLPMENIITIAIVSILFVAGFVFFNFYRYNFKGNAFEYFKHVISTYLITLIVVTLVLILIQKCPLKTDTLLAIKRIILVSLPCVMSGTLSDTLKYYPNRIYQNSTCVYT